MRRSAVVAVGVVFVGVLIASACGPKSNGGGPGPTPTPTATVTPTPGPLHLAVQEYRGLPIAGVRVWVVDSSGTLATQTVTGADGTVSIDVPRPATVTLEHDQPNGIDDQTEIRTFVDVQNGDQLSATMLADLPEPSVVAGTAQFLVPGAFTGATRYTASALGCLVGGSTTDPSAVIHPIALGSCASPMLDPVALALDDGAADPELAFSIANAVTTAELFSQTVDFPSWRTDWDTATFDLTAVPAAGASDVSADLQPYTANGPLPATSIDVSAPSADIHLTRNLLPASAVATGFGVNVIASTDSSRRSVVVGRADGALTHLTYALDTDLLPFVVGPTGSVVGSDLTLTWTGGGDPAAEDLLQVSLFWFHTANDSVTWTITAPPQPGSYVIPRLPDDLAAYRANRVTGQLHEQVTLYDVDVYDGYTGAARNGQLPAAGAFSARYTLDGQ